MALVAPLSWRGTEQASGIPRTLLTTTKHQLLLFKVKKSFISFEYNRTPQACCNESNDDSHCRYSWYATQDVCGHKNEKPLQATSQTDTILPVAQRTCPRAVGFMFRPAHLLFRSV